MTGAFLSVSARRIRHVAMATCAQRQTQQFTQGLGPLTCEGGGGGGFKNSKRKVIHSDFWYGLWYAADCFQQNYVSVIAEENCSTCSVRGFKRNICDDEAGCV